MSKSRFREESGYYLLPPEPNAEEREFFLVSLGNSMYLAV
jgi:hypothetical protein